MALRMSEHLDDFSETDFQEWKRHPMSAAFFRWMDDKRKDYMATFMLEWEAGDVPLTREHEFKHRIAYCRELNDLHLSDIKLFYEQQEKL